jgi:hypothetical protein
MPKKTACVAVRLEPEDFDFLQAVAARLELPTDGRPIIGRAVQQIIRFMRASVTPDAVAGQRMLGQQSLQVAGA